jgi:hypothetical protein
MNGDAEVTGHKITANRGLPKKAEMSFNINQKEAI